jgi:hypothetical protein
MAGIREGYKRLTETGHLFWGVSILDSNVPYLFYVRNMFFGYDGHLHPR